MIHRHMNALLSALRHALVICVLAGLAFGMSPKPAKAAGVALADCTGLHSAGWDPGVTNTPAEHVVSTTTNWLCTGTGGLLSPASSAQNFSAFFACSGLLEPVNGLVWTIHWNDGVQPATSTFAFNVSVEAVDGNLVITSNNGNITAGRYAGSSAVATFTLLNLAGLLGNQCNAPGGLTGGGGPSTLTIIGL